MTERNVVPMPRQIIKALRGVWSREASVKCAIILVMGVRKVIPVPFTKSRRFMPAPSAITVAVESRSTLRPADRASKSLVASKTQSASARIP